MAEEAYGKSVKQLKLERTMAKGAFTKVANFLSRGARGMTETELREEFKKLTLMGKNVSEANDDFRSGLLADIEDEDEDVEGALSKQQEADIGKTIDECEIRMNDVKIIVQTNLWSRYGQKELETSIQEAETACDNAAETPVSALNRDGYEMQLVFMEKLVKEANKSLASWELWIPETEKAILEGRVKDLKSMNNKLEARRAEYMFAQRNSEEEKSAYLLRTAASSTPHAANTTPLVRIKPISLPKFHGCKRDFHRWKRDWESLQRQGEPTGSREVKKIQLLDSMDEKISRNLRLSTYNTAENIFRVLENRYGNKSTIAIEIIEDLDKKG